MQLTDSEFENGGGQYWSFEKLTYSSGEYSKFSKYSDKSLATFLHPWDPERFMGELIEDHSTWDSSLALNNYQWYKNRGFAWCDVERQDPEIQNIDELLLQESWSYITRDFEFIPTIGWTPVISFKVPQDGYYLFKGEIVRIDGSYNDATALFAKARYRSSGTDKVAVIGGLISEKYGKERKEVDGFAWDPGRLNQHYTIQEPTSISFAFNAKKGDIISFEGDCSHLPYNTDSWGRSMNSKSKWLKLNLQVIDEATAKANETFVDPTYDEYYDKLILLSDEVLSIVGESSYGDGFNEYPEKSGEELMAVYNLIVENGRAHV